MTNWKTLGLLVAATALGAVSSAGAVPSRVELSSIMDYVERRDDDGLRAYLTANPYLLEDDLLGDELLVFLRTQPREGLLVAIGLASPFPRALTRAVETALKSIY